MVTIRIRKGNNHAVLITFQAHTDKFDSLSERSKFFEKLYGRRQKIIRERRVYEYHREGVLDSVNHLKVDNSVFIVPMKHLKRMEEFFNEWEDKVMVKKFPVILDKKELRELRGD